MNIDTHREKIDEIDQKILSLIKQRQDVVELIQEIKKKKGMNLKDENRQENIIQNLLDSSDVRENLIREVWGAIFEDSMEK